MKDQLVRYIDLLFAGAPQAGEIKQEILQNTLDRYDDLIAQGKTPEAAYRLAISGIGDINEILGGEPQTAARQPSPPSIPQPRQPEPVWKRIVRGFAILLYILCPVPLLVLQDEFGVCGLLALVGVATALMVIPGKAAPHTPVESDFPAGSPQQELRRSIRSAIWAVGLCVYFILSFATGAWYITWVIFPIIAAAQGLVIACMDLKEANKYER